MEIGAERYNMIDLMLRPAFWVENGIIRHINPAGAFLLLREGQPVSALIISAQEEYAQFCDGCLHLELRINGQNMGTMVTQSSDGQLFLPDLPDISSQFRSLSLAAMQLRGIMTGLMAVTDRIFPEPDPQDAAQANRRFHQMLRIINNMSDAQQFTIRDNCRKEYTEICGFLEELLEKASGLLSHTGLQLQSTLPQESIYTLVDRQQLERAVYNLLSNAAKFGIASDVIQVQLTRRAQKLYLSVQNSGTPSAPGSFYDRFLREPSLEDPSHGIGLGMVLIRSFAANHDGAVLIDQPDSGNTRVTMSMSVCHSKGDLVRSPILRIDYAGETDHGLLEFSDILPAELYKN